MAVKTPASEQGLSPNAEVTPGKSINLPGIYRHMPTGKELIILPDGESTAQADALVRMGYTRIAEPPTRKELADMQAAQLKADIASGVHDSSESYPTPGTQEVVFNGSVTDVNGPGDALAAKDAEIADLQAQLLEAQSAEATPEATPEKKAPAKKAQSKDKTKE